MDKNKIIVIGVTSLVVITILYAAFKKRNMQNAITENQLQKDFEKVIRQIDNAKK
jgi:hypothetical protein